ncbi:PH domain-containing protein [Bacillus sp. FJAT-52991]|uniref:PH domain-containing protein n=1 Tax=Bacillus kandeliae TaxID=3129297 RepID=A0ABZ2N7P2_9BACI
MEQPLKKLHPLKMVLDLWKVIKENAFFFLFLFILNFNSDKTYIEVLQIAFIVYVLGRVLWSVLDWFTYKYEIKGNTIYIHSGIFSKSYRTVPFSKVQNIQRRTTVFHKLFHVTSMTLETATAGDESSVTIDALLIKEADQLEQRVNMVRARESLVNEELELDLDREEESEVAAPVAESRVIHFTPTKSDLLKASFTSLSFLILIPLFFKFIDILPIEALAEDFFERISKSWWLISVVIVALVILSVVIGMIHTFVKYGKYEISSSDQTIYINKGVLEESAFSIQKEKVQAVVITQSFMKRLLGFAEVQLISAGQTASESVETNSLYPFLPIQRAYEMIAEILPAYHVEENMEKLTKQALWIRMIRHSVFWVIVIAAVLYFKPSYWYIPVALTVFVYLVKVLNCRNSRYRMTDGFIQMKTGAFSTSLFITKRSKVIEIEATQSKLQRLFGLATIKTVNRAQPIHHEELDDVPAEVADEFYSWYAVRTNEVMIAQPEDATVMEGVRN